MVKKKIAALMLTCIVASSIIGCSSKVPNRGVNESKEIEDNIKNNKYNIYKVTQGEKGKNLRIVATNPLKEDITLNFNTTQEYEFILLKKGKEVYRFSKNRSFGEMIVKKVVEPKRSLEYNIDLESLELEKGDYDYEFYLVANELKALPHKKGTLTIEKKDIDQKDGEDDKVKNPSDSVSNNSGIAHFPLKYNINVQNEKSLVVEVKNQNERPIDINYTSGQKYDMKFYKKGKLVYTWSQDKSFIQMICETKLIQGASEVYEVDLTELPLEKGSYEYEFYSVAKELSDVPHLEGKITID
ncbi:hypothetical protein GOM49_03375 [Clostridium bovifaecis]|uniref:Intracellular proteinase inhibitor BsuPI domain-containing protein n=1 Tax=Clostridium bovifaecis TaxID=2184719 RepID=A0A6I6EPH9_9CLOT|nr:hypothetical protein GOM49_03375 [Clostridium bovifaecis]